MVSTSHGIASSDQRMQESHRRFPAGSHPSPAPSLTNASSSARSFPDAHATPSDSQNNFDPHIASAGPSQSLQDAKRLFSERSLIRVLSPPDAPIASSQSHEASESQQQQQQQQRQRMRVHSNPNMKPQGFPYCNSPNMLFQQQQQFGDWRISVTSNNSSANSSDDVDLDLSWEAISPPSGAPQRQHVGIDMGTLAVAESASPHELFQQHSDSSFSSNSSGSLGSNSRCRSALDLRTRAKLDAQKLIASSTASSSAAAGQRHPNMSGPSDSFLTEGWSFNRTPPSPDFNQIFPSQSAQEVQQHSVTRRASGSLRNKRSVPAPLRIWFDRSPRLNRNNNNNSTNNDTPLTFATDSNFGSPATSHSPMTPRSPGGAQLASRVEVVEGGVEEHSEEGHIGQFPQYSSMSLSEFGSFGQGLVTSSTVTSSAYKTAQSMPTSLAGAMEELSSSRSGGLQGLGFQHVHFPESVDERPAHDRPTHPGLRPSPSNDVSLSPRSDASRSPNPDSPLMGSDAYQQQSSQHLQSAGLRAPSVVPAKNEVSNRQATNPRRLLSHSGRRRNWLRQWLDDMVPAKTFFILGFLGMPWLWFIGGWLLRPDGEFWGTRGAPCRCSAKSASAGLHCPADVHRSLRLLGVRASGEGLMHDIRQLNSEGQNKAALLNVNTKQASGFILANRVAAVAASTVVVATFVVAVVAVSVAFSRLRRLFLC